VYVICCGWRFPLLRGFAASGTFAVPVNHTSLHDRCMQQPVKLCSLGVDQQNSLWVVMFLASYFTLRCCHGRTWTTTQHNKLQSLQLWYSGVAVIQLHQEAGTHAYMPSNEAQLPDTYAIVARRSHTCLYTVWCVSNHATYPEVVAISDKSQML
jgi:hypothetical protein